MSSEVMEKIMSGALDRLPTPSTNVIRLFFSSTFTDMKEERNKLMREVVPELKSYCQERHFEFEVVDMRWGVREDAYADHATTDMCLREIANCQILSEGPNFVLFVGNRYGSRPLPSAIPVTEFRLFRRLAYWMELNFETVEKWYRLDTNAIPPEYRILPITTLLPFFNNMNPVNKTKRLVHLDNWNSDERNMKDVIRKVALMALQQGKISAEACNKFFVSVTENEAEKGILKSNEVKDKVLCFRRSFENINVSDPLTSRFTDLKNGELDQEAQDLLQKLTMDKIPAKIPEQQIVDNTLKWSPNGIDPEDDIHARYLEMFAEWFKTLTIQQIDKCMQRCWERQLKNHVMIELMSHLRPCAEMRDCFFGQDELLNQLFRMMQKVIKSNGKETEVVQEEHEINSNESEDKVGEDEEKKGEEVKESDDKIAEEVKGEEIVPEENTKDVQSNDVSDGENGDQAQKEDKEEDDETAQKFKEIDVLAAHYKSMGDKAPTFGRGDVGYDRSSDPSINIKQDLIKCVFTDDIKRPIVIYGESGSGKTALMARMAYLIKKWEPNAVVLIRFLGTTSNSRTIRALLISICEHIWAVYKVIPPGDLDLTADVIYLGQYLQALIWKVSTPSQPLYILLDSLDQLAPLEQAHSLTWLPTVLPAQGSLIISTLPLAYNILESARRLLSSADQFIEVPPFSEAAAQKVISSICNSKSRSITRPQRDFMNERFRECPIPLYLRLITYQALSWRSHFKVKDLLLGSDIANAITHFFMTLEKNHGIILVTKAFGYLTCMNQGAVSFEIGDLLSLDNEVLQDTYIHHLPPDPHNITIPSSVWSNLLIETTDFLSMDTATGVSLMKWYHRAFSEAASERYLTEENKKTFHRACARYFQGYWYKRNKPLKLFKEKKGWYPENIRQIASQALYFKDGRLNQRKLAELPYHLAMAGLWKDFHRDVVCNIDFLVARAKMFSVTELRSDLMLMLKQRYDLSEEEEEEEEDQPPTEDGDEGEEEKPDEAQEENKNNEEYDKEKEEENPDDPSKVDEDLFLTENKKQGQSALLEKEAEEPEASQDTSKASSMNLESLQEAAINVDLATALKDIEILIDILTLGINAIRLNANNIAAQIVCQLGKTKAPSESLQKLVDDSIKWMYENSSPIMMPQDACMPKPGEMLQTSINMEVHLIGADRMRDCPIQYSPKEQYLFAVEQASQKTDTLVVLDMAQGGEKVMVDDTKTYVHSLRFNGSKRYLIMCCYKEMSMYNPVLNYHLYEKAHLIRYQLEKEAFSMDVSTEGDIVAYADERCCFICSPKREEMRLETIYRLHHTETISSLMFSPDAYYLLTFMPGDGFKVWIPRRGESTLEIEGKKKANFSFDKQSKSGRNCIITSNHNLLQVLTDFKENNVIRICDLSTGDILHVLTSPELAYSISLMDIDSDEEYLIVATTETSLMNGNRSKSALLWNIEKGKLISRVASTCSFEAVKVLQKSNSIYILTASGGDPCIQVYSVGLRHRPLAGAKLIRQISGHSKFLLQLLLITGEDLGNNEKLISASSDNTVKFWDLQQVLQPQPKKKEQDIGATTQLAYSKSGDAIFLGTDKGHIQKHTVSNGTITPFTTYLECPVAHLMVSRNGKLLIATGGNMIYVYYIETGELEYTLESCQKSNISCIAESNNVLVAGHSGMEGKGRIWDLSNGHVINDVSFLYAFYQTAISPQGTQLGVTMFEYPIMVQVFGGAEAETPIQMNQVDSMMSGCTCLHFSPNGNMLASSSVDGRIRVVDTEDGRYLHSMVQPSSVTTFIFSWDNRQLFSAGYRYVYIWNVGDSHAPNEQGQLHVKLSRHGNFVTSLQLVLDGRFLVTGSLDKTIAIWSMKTYTTICSFNAHCPVERALAAPDLSTICFIPERSANVAVLKLNQAALEILRGIQNKPVPAKVKKAQSVALTFSTQEVTQNTSTTCTIL